MQEIPEKIYPLVVADMNTVVASVVGQVFGTVAASSVVVVDSTGIVEMCTGQGQGSNAVAGYQLPDCSIQLAIKVKIQLHYICNKTCKTLKKQPTTTKNMCISRHIVNKYCEIISVCVIGVNFPEAKVM